MRIFFLLMAFCFLPVWLMAQGKGTKAERKSMRSQYLIRKEKNERAVSNLKKAIAAAPSDPEGYRALGNFYLDQKQYSKAADIFREATRVCAACANTFAIPLATSLCNAQQFLQAEAVLASWQVPHNLIAERKRELEVLKSNIQFGKYALAHQWPDTPVNLGLRINSQFDEYFPNVSPDDSTLWFTRKSAGIDEDFYVAHRDTCDDGIWLSARDMGSPPNSLQQEGARFISADGHYLFFMRCDNRSVNGFEAGGCDVYFSYTDSLGGWSDPVAFSYTINTTAFEGMPCLSSDNKEMFFVSDRSGGMGGRDIWVSRFEDGLWQVPQNLGPEINTPFDETAPYIAPDNKTLYFTSNGLPGMGGHDIYISRRSMSGQWQAPSNIGYPFNSSYDDVSFCLNPDGSKGYLASDRPGGWGKFDLYEIKLPEELKPDPYTYVVGRVYDSLTKEPVTYAQIEWNNTLEGENIFKVQANKGDGSYMIAVPLNQSFALNVYRIGYEDYQDTVVYRVTNTAHPDTLNIAMLPHGYQDEPADAGTDFSSSTPVVSEAEAGTYPATDSDLDIISGTRTSFPPGDASSSIPDNDTLLYTFYFDRADASLTPFYEQRAVSIGQQYLKSATIFIVNGFTDDKGNPLLNEEISFLRARKVAEMLRWAGVDSSRIVIRGWSDANPVAPNDTEEARNLNRRVEVVLQRSKSSEE